MKKELQKYLIKEDPVGFCWTCDYRVISDNLKRTMSAPQWYDIHCAVEWVGKEFTTDMLHPDKHLPHCRDVLYTDKCTKRQTRR